MLSSYDSYDVYVMFPLCVSLLSVCFHVSVLSVFVFVCGLHVIYVDIYM